MNYKKLTIMVEGSDDVTFFKRVIIPELKLKYRCYVDVWQYATKTKKSIKKYIKTFSQVAQWDYMFVCDLDNEPCIKDRVNRRCLEFNNLTPDKCDVVVKEIESWYFAGIDNSNIKKLGLKIVSDTETMDKEKFNSMLPANTGSRINFMIEMLNVYDCQLATNKNRSFKHYYDKYLL